MIGKFFLSAFLCAACSFACAQTAVGTHIVQRGETMESIAKSYGVSVESLNKLNPNTEGLIYVGMKLNVPQGAYCCCCRTDS